MYATLLRFSSLLKNNASWMTCWFTAGVFFLRTPDPVFIHANRGKGGASWAHPLRSHCVRYHHSCSRCQDTQDTTCRRHHGGEAQYFILTYLNIVQRATESVSYLVLWLVVHRLLWRMNSGCLCQEVLICLLIELSKRSWARQRSNSKTKLFLSNSLLCLRIHPRLWMS